MATYNNKTHVKGSKPTKPQRKQTPFISTTANSRNILISRDFTEVITQIQIYKKGKGVETHLQKYKQVSDTAWCTDIVEMINRRQNKRKKHFLLVKWYYFDISFSISQQEIIIIIISNNNIAFGAVRNSKATSQLQTSGGSTFHMCSSDSALFEAHSTCVKI